MTSAQITEDLVPELRRRGLFPHAYEAARSAGCSDWPRPANRYATA